MGETVIYTGAIDAFYDYALGKLEYRTVRFETEVLDTDNYQGVAVVNYTDRETPYTRVIEHKHFEFGTQKKTVISREYSTDWKVGLSMQLLFRNISLVWKISKIFRKNRQM